MWPNIKKYVSSFRATPKKAPQTASYVTIKEACEDPLKVTQLECSVVCVTLVGVSVFSVMCSELLVISEIS